MCSLHFFTFILYRLFQLINYKIICVPKLVWGCSQAIDGFPVTLSNCKVKTTKFYEFLFTLAWRWTKNRSLYKFPFPWHISLQKYSNLNFRVFTVRDTKIGMLSRWKKSLLLIFSSITISSITGRYVYAHVC